MNSERTKRVKLNILISFGSQIIALVCGFIVPRLLIQFFGSEAYGATSSISQLLSYIALLEGGIGGVARAVLYKPLAENDNEQIGSILAEIKYFFRIIGYIFFIYVMTIAFFFKEISNIQVFDWISTFLLVIVISISIFGQYFVGISYSILLQAAQRQYITSVINISTTLLNTIFVVLLVSSGRNLIIVKLVSSLIFFLRPVLLYFYANKYFDFDKKAKRNKNALNQKWAGLGQHIAYFIHTNTDVAILTVFGDLTLVAVYSVYQMVIYGIQNLTSSFTTGMESIFGDMLAKKEIKLLEKSFEQYETLVSITSMMMFGSTAVLIVPFISVYTKGITDTNYIQPLFAILLVVGSLINSLRTPYHSMTIAAGRFKETQVAAYGEALINIVISTSLVMKYGLIGVAVGTVVAISFRFLFYVVYLSRHIIIRNNMLFIRRIFVNTVNFASIYVGGSIVVSFFTINNYLGWAIAGVFVTIFSIIITFIINIIFYNTDLRIIMSRLINH